MQPIHATTACLPGFSPPTAIKMICDGLFEPGLGLLNSSHIQICPQNPGHLNEKNCENLKETFPRSQLRLHANARVFPTHQLLDASCFSKETQPYFQALSDRSHRLQAPGYSLHAGYQENASLKECFDSVSHIQDLFGDIPVALEGLYPSKHRPQLMDSWADYEALLNSGLWMAIDMSHLQIVAQSQGWQRDLVQALIRSPQCLEIHVSDNDGRRDNHLVIDTPPTWLGWLNEVGDNVVVFSEGDQVRAQKKGII